MRLILFALFIFVTSCNTDSQIIINKDEIVPLSIANNFTMTYTDSTITRSYVSGKLIMIFQILNLTTLNSSKMLNL